MKYGVYFTTVVVIINHVSMSYVMGDVTASSHTKDKTKSTLSPLHLRHPHRRYNNDKIMRQGIIFNQTPKRQTVPTLPFDINELPSQELGPERSATYDPSYGYEPYWTGGEWVYKNLNVYQTGDPDINCGEKCPAMYKMYGIICARNKNFHFKTFYNHCEMRSEDCNDIDEWRTVYRGGCQTNRKPYYSYLRDDVSPIINRFISIYRFTEKFIGYESRPTRSTTKPFNFNL